MKTCCGGIVGMGESREQRAGLLQTLANLPAHPDSVPINRLVQVEGTPLAGTAQLDPFEFVRTIAVARILMPHSMVRLSAGRESMSDELQALCFLAGANSIFYGEKLLTTGNPDTERDQALFARLGLRPMPVRRTSGETVQPTSSNRARSLCRATPPARWPWRVRDLARAHRRRAHASARRTPRVRVRRSVTRRDGVRVARSTATGC